MIKLGLKNIKILSKLTEIPVIKHFFVLRISENFCNISNEKVLNKFYTDIYVDSKTSKKTQNNRFTDLDNLTINFLKESDNNIHDIAVSSGITSLELFNFLEKNNVDFKLTISDKYSQINVKKGFFTKAYDSEHKLIFGYLACFFAADKNIYFPLTMLFFKILKKMKNNRLYDYKLNLFHPGVIEKINNNKIQQIDYDIFSSKIDLKFNFIRCMNILNNVYFTEELIIRSVENIKSSLSENGILLIGRTDKKGKNNATFFKYLENHFVVLKDINSGSEIKKLILKI